MNLPPITAMTLYKHGVGFYERQAECEGEVLDLVFRSNEMNDALKSLTILEQGDGKILSIEYPTPKSKLQRLAGCTINLDKIRSLRDLIFQLRGRHIALHTKDPDAMDLTGQLLGLDEFSANLQLPDILISILLDKTAQVETRLLKDIQSITILDENAVSDLRFFLETATQQENDCRVRVHLSPGKHKLSIHYLTAAPTWRVSYRMVYNPSQKEALILGWGIFDNNLEEDLKNIRLALTAGMPVSFIYDLFTPYTPQRPTLQEEQRTAALIASYDESTPESVAEKPFEVDLGFSAIAPAPAQGRPQMKNMVNNITPNVESKNLGELFQYRISTPVTVGRGQSAMAPILANTLSCQKVLLFNSVHNLNHPHAVLRFRNKTELTLERGPVTIIEDDEYVGEAVLPFSPSNSEIFLAYAVELGIKITHFIEESQELYRLHISGYYLVFEDWDIKKTTYTIINKTSHSETVTIEHPHGAEQELFNTPQATEIAPGQLRFEIKLEAHKTTKFTIQQRSLRQRREKIEHQTPTTINDLLKRGLLNPQSHALLTQFLTLWERLATNKEKIKQIEIEEGKIYKAQEQIRSNLQALKDQGAEGELRFRYIEKLKASEARLSETEPQKQRLNADNLEIEAQIEQLLKSAA